MGCSGKEAVAFTKSLFSMLSKSILDQIKSSHTQLESRLEAKMDAQNSSMKAEMSHLRWFAGIVVAVLGGYLQRSLP